MNVSDPARLAPSRLGARLWQSWMRGAKAVAGPLTVIFFTYGALWGVVAVVRLLAGFAPWGLETNLWTLGLTVLVGPLFVTRGWLDR